MHNYELMFVVRPTLEEEATLNVLANIKTICQENFFFLLNLFHL